MRAFLALRAKKRAFRSNLFCRKAAKKDFRCNPGCMGERQRSSVATSPLRGLRASGEFANANS
jgi:hypothetical protein